MSTNLYPFDPELREHVARLLYDHLPALYRVRDQGSEELWSFLRVLAAPLAELRQNIEELHGDLFIDTCNAWVIPYIAEMVGTTLIFPDAPSNRRDVRGTVAFRRRKGTPRALEEMGSDLSGQVVVTQEGWKRLLIIQDIDFIRPERVVTDLRPATLAESATGPLDSSYHVLDPRNISQTSGRHHPRHLVHWIHPTRLFPVREGTPFERTNKDGGGLVLDPDLRYTMNPLGHQGALRARRAHPGDPISTDRVPPMHFAVSPGDYFDLEGSAKGRFLVRVSGLSAAVSAESRALRPASKRAAASSLASEAVLLELFEEPLDGLTASVDLEVFLVPVNAGTGLADMSLAKWRGGIRIPVLGKSSALSETIDTTSLSKPVVMVRLKPSVTGKAAHFPGATIELACQASDARHESLVPSLAAEGFLRGALLVKLPRTWVHDDRWLYVAADGSVYTAQSETAVAAGDDPDIAVEIDDDDVISYSGEALVTGPGPAWPSLGRTAEGERMRRVPSAPGRGPVFLHGGPVHKKTGNTLADLGNSPTMALTFAARITGGAVSYLPFLRLGWSGDDPFSSDAFDVLGVDLNGDIVPLLDDVARRDRLREIAELREENVTAIELVVRFEAQEASLVLPPCEVSFTSDDGKTILIHLPELSTSASNNSDWSPSPAPYAYASVPVSVGVDGSTRFVGGSDTARFACGAVAPLANHPTLRRRRVRQRNLCGWDREEPNAVPPKLLAATPAGFIDIDPAHGLFSLCIDEPPRPFPAEPGSTSRPSPVTVDYLEGYSDHLGARPDAREPILDQRQPEPTRIVSASGKLHSGAPAEWHGLPRYRRFEDALAAIASSTSAEVIQFEDSATYVVEPGGLSWPAPAVAIDLTIQAAESQRPVIRINGAFGVSGAPRYSSITLRGLVLDATSVEIPPADRVMIQFCTIADPSCVTVLNAPTDVDPIIEIERSITGQLSLSEPGKLLVRDSVIDSSSQAIVAARAACELERVTVICRESGLPVDKIGTEVLALEATHVIFLDKVLVHDRFHGCVRYSRVAAGSVLPRKHRVVETQVRFVTRDRRDPAHARLAADCAPEILRGAEDGSEMGAFHDVRFAQRQEALVRRLVDFTPAGLVTGIVRMD